MTAERPAAAPDHVPAARYRDPVYDGATDPIVIRDGDGWRMFYTQRRATHPDPGPGVAWVHGSRIGVARSRDGLAWEYSGTLEPTADGLQLQPGPPPDAIAETHWAPEVIFDGDRWRMYLTEIDGVPDRWDGSARAIVEYRSDDLDAWRRVGPVALSSDRVIDAGVARCPDGLWRLWFKDEAAGSTTGVAVSGDLASWRLEGIAIGGRPHEGPAAFALGGWWWMIVDEWRGMGIYRSADAVNWQRQGGPDAVMLGEAGPPGTGIQIGRHGSVSLAGDGENATFWYFTHPWWDGSEIADAEVSDAEGPTPRVSAVHAASLRVVDDRLVCER
ncbi:family 43 glycosylhydrolase [Microbacterium sp.]|uniref:family 43 glycosylhydrolase n=1 Tax=Microbacterium sp. TaxID=51671 RepID=UPI002E369DE4|nr:family 43 glycosylhydrolase [Microbacterium sp.]HEX5731121.1 family 43 glycosylhydrolase [Microbacterium sp.]